MVSNENNFMVYKNNGHTFCRGGCTATCAVATLRINYNKMKHVNTNVNGGLYGFISTLKRLNVVPFPLYHLPVHHIILSLYFPHLLL